MNFRIDNKNSQVNEKGNSMTIMTERQKTHKIV